VASVLAWAPVVSETKADSAPRDGTGRDGTGRDGIWIVIVGPPRAYRGPVLSLSRLQAPVYKKPRPRFTWILVLATKLSARQESFLFPV
jgi:hypothetical protein